MKIICGLGNPGQAYKAHRHNIGHVIVDSLSTRWNTPFVHSGVWNAKLARTQLSGNKVLILKPETFMNMSGIALNAVAHFYKVFPGDILVVHDDVDLPFETLRLKSGGSTGGHNGLNSIQAFWHDGSYGRLRFGIGRPQSEFIVAHVLGHFAPMEAQEIPRLVERCCVGIEAWVTHGIQKAMNSFNRK